MTYKIKYLQFGTDNDVPGYGPIDVASPKVPVYPQIASGGHFWDLVFSYESGTFYRAGVMPPATPGATIEAFYWQEGVPGPLKHSLSLTPFLIDENGQGAFANATHFVDFSQPTVHDGTIDTDAILAPSVTATVHMELPQYAKSVLTAHSSSHALIFTTVETHAKFDHIFVYAGDDVPSNTVITTKQGHTCLALAVFKLSSTTSSFEVSTYKYPSIRETEWPQIISQIAKTLARPGEIYSYFAPDHIAALDEKTLKLAVAAIRRRGDQLEAGKVGVALPAGQSDK